MNHMLRHAVFSLLILLGTACSPMVVYPGPAIQPPAMSGEALTMTDGAVLPLHVWRPETAHPNTVVIALHGFNDYGLFFNDLAVYLAKEGVTSYAYDQRGFGSAPNRGYWAGSDAYVDDLKTTLALVRQRHPGVPIFLFGESMGGAVLLSALADSTGGSASYDGVILAAPAVWARETMPFYQRWALWLGSHSVPWMKLSGRGLKIKASDNIEMLRALGRDPLVIKETRIDAIWGLVNLMDRAMDSAPRFTARALILYGAQDQIIKKRATLAMLRRLPAIKQSGQQSRQRIAVYENGFHMLIRDLGAVTYWKDIAVWMRDPDAPLPSGADRPGIKSLEVTSAP